VHLVLALEQGGLVGDDLLEGLDARGRVLREGVGADDGKVCASRGRSLSTMTIRPL
jgi:hypothetical protein